MKLQADNARATHELLRLVIGVAAGALSGAVIGAAVAGYMQLLQEPSGTPDPEMSWIFLAAFVGGFGGALAGAALGLLTGLVLVVRGSSGGRARLR
jgi:NhaP-type Na+/H+ or K+/H+ antiporter